MVCDEDGRCVGPFSDSAHPLQIPRVLFREITLFLENGANEIELHFSEPPLSVSVKRWGMSSWYDVQYDHDNIDRAVNEYELVDINGMTIYVVDDGQSYIYEVHAIWYEGFSRYAFRTESNQSP